MTTETKQSKSLLEPVSLFKNVSLLHPQRSCKSFCCVRADLKQFNLRDPLYRVLQLLELMMHPSVTHHYRPQKRPSSATCT